MTSSPTAVGCRVKSGWAATVLLAGPVTAPTVVDRRRIELSDPTIPASIQPYHAAFGTEQGDRAEVQRLTQIVRRCADESLADLVQQYRAMGFRPRWIGIVVGSMVDPLSIANQHIRAHAHEGRLFRTVIEEAAKRHRIAAMVILERELYATAARRLGGSEQRIRKLALDLGHEIGRPWRAEQKSAAIAALLVLGR